MLTIFRDHIDKGVVIIDTLLDIPNLINKMSKEINQIKGLALIGELELKNTDNTLHFNIVDEIWLITKSLFENNSYAISKLGMIKKDKNEYS